MGSADFSPPNRLAHYHAWRAAWLTVEPSTLSAEKCLRNITKDGPLWLRGTNANDAGCSKRLSGLVSSFKTAAKARKIPLGGKVPPSCDECDVLFGSFNARVQCGCSGLYPVSNARSATDPESCGCKAIERMMAEGALVSGKEDEGNSSILFTSSNLSSAMVELALCHADTQPTPSSCCGEEGKPHWPEVQAPDRKPHPENDLSNEVYNSLFPTHERIRLSADAKHFFAIASAASLVDPGIQLAIADSGNDILIGDYCDAATDDCLRSLQAVGASGFSFLKLCVYAGLMTDWQSDHLVAQIIHFRVISYWRDHALSRRPRGVYGTRMTGFDVHRQIDLGMVVGIVSASMATGQEISMEDYKELVATTVLINDLLDFRGDAWRKQRENVVLRGVRGSLCTYLDGLISQVVRGAATTIRRGKIFALVNMCFCNWMLMSSGHKIYELLHQTKMVAENPLCTYESKGNGAYEGLLETFEPYGTLGESGPHVDMTRSELTALCATQGVA
jgi:hypothetical protein